MESLYRWLYEKLGWRKEQTDQNMLVAGILAVVFVLLGIFFMSVPWAKPVATFIIIFFLKAVAYTLTFVFLILGLWFLGHFGVRRLVEYFDELRASSISLQPWVHWLFNISLSLFLGRLWSAYVVGLVFSIPGFVQTTFLNWGWYVDGVVQGAGWWWVIGSLMFFFGYFWKGIKESM